MEGKTKAVIFDLGGTLLHYQNRNLSEVADRVCQNPAIAAKIVETFKKWRQKSSLTFCEVSIPKIIKWVYRNEGIVLNDNEFYNLVQIAYFLTHTPFMLYPDVSETLAGLKNKDLRMGIISNTCWPSELFKADMAHVRISDYFEAMVWSHEFGIRKPDMRIFLEGLRRMNLRPDEAIYVGNEPSKDVVGAHSVGMKAVWINRAGQTLGQGPEVPDWNIRDLRELISIIE